MLHKLPSFDSDCALLPISVFQGWHENCLKEYLFFKFYVFYSFSHSYLTEVLLFKMNFY